MKLSKVRTCLWFESKGEEAAAFYVSLLPNSEVVTTSPMVTELMLAGTPYMFLNGGPRYQPTPAASIVVDTNNQAETDRLWDALIADGGQESRCGWLVDRFGVSWQIVPHALIEMIGAPDRDAAKRAMDAMLAMRKIDIATLEAAFKG